LMIIGNPSQVSGLNDPAQNIAQQVCDCVWSATDLLAQLTVLLWGDGNSSSACAQYAHNCTACLVNGFATTADGCVWCITEFVGACLSTVGTTCDGERQTSILSANLCGAVAPTSSGVTSASASMTARSTSSLSQTTIQTLQTVQTTQSQTIASTATISSPMITSTTSAIVTANHTRSSPTIFTTKATDLSQSSSSAQSLLGLYISLAVLGALCVVGLAVLAAKRRRGLAAFEFKEVRIVDCL
jgi:hypothetical protein